MLTIRPVGRAAWVRVTALIWVSKGYQGAMHGRVSCTPSKPRCSAYWLLYARIGLSGAACPWGRPPILCARRKARYESHSRNTG
jgi:hypothetical protein